MSGWAETLQEKIDPHAIKYLVCNKIDRVDISVDRQEGKEMAKKIGFEFFETSGYTGAGIKSML